MKLQKIILNLLFNAIKFTPAGGTVQVSAAKLQPSSAGMTYRFEVADNGIAMTADAFAENIKEAMDAGMNSYVTKPVVPERLFAELHKYCG